LSLAAIGAFALFYYDLYVPFKRPAFYVLVLVSLPSLFGTFNKNRIDAWIAELSFPVYMVHMLVIYVLHGYLERNQRYAGLTYAFVSVGAAAILYYCMVPFETFRKWLFRRSAKEKYAPAKQPDERVFTAEPLVD
jgi:peptidoglycan/LPS O-acetylase OafA/YrhL